MREERNRQTTQRAEPTTPRRRKKKSSQRSTTNYSARPIEKKHRRESRQHGSKKRSSNERSHKGRSRDDNRYRQSSREAAYTPEPERKSLGKKLLTLVWSLLFYMITFSILISAVLFAFSDNEDKNVFGYRVLGVLTNSMSPKEGSPKGGFYAGDVIIVRDIPGEEANVGDILTFRPKKDSKTFLTHRAVKKMDDLKGAPGPYFITQGDANNAEDLPIHASQVVGKTVFVIPKMGSILKFMRNNMIVSAVFIISVFGFVLVIRMYFFS